MSLITRLSYGVQEGQAPIISLLDKLYSLGYKKLMFEIVQSATFSQWLENLKDRQARMRIHAKLDRVVLGNLGDVRPIGHGLSELRIYYGPGYRLYCMQPEMHTLVMLCGGDKSSQTRDIEQARTIANDWKGGKNG